MAIYATPELAPDRARASTCGVDLQVVAGPPRDRDPGDVGFIFWAMQISFVDRAGNGVGGGHFGLQWYAASPRTGFGVINWGVYDDTVGDYAAFRGSIPDDPAFVDIENPPSWGYSFDYGDWCRFRCSLSPRQDWMADELDEGHRQPATYRGCGQRADEVAFRVTVENLTVGSGPIAYRDVLIKHVDLQWAFAAPVLWTEVDHRVLARGPIARFANLYWDGDDRIDQVRVGYSPGTVDTDCSIDQDGAIRQAGATPRRTPAAARLMLPH